MSHHGSGDRNSPNGFKDLQPSFTFTASASILHYLIALDTRAGIPGMCQGHITQPWVFTALTTLWMVNHLIKCYSSVFVTCHYIRRQSPSPEYIYSGYHYPAMYNRTRNIEILSPFPSLQQSGVLYSLFRSRHVQTVKIIQTQSNK